MDSNSQPGASGPPRKPWETTGTSSGPTPFKPPSGGSTSDVVEASGTARPGEIVSAADRTAAANRNSLGRPVPSRPWEQQQNYGGTSYGGGYNSGLNYNSSLNYNTGYGSGMYGSSYGGGLGGSLGGLGGGLGGGLYGNSLYRGGYGGGGGLYGGSSMYGGYGGQMGGYGGQMGGYGGQMGGYGMGMGPYGDQDPNNPYGGLPSPPGFWMSFLRVMQGVVSFFGRISILIDQNTQAFHMFMSALLQLFDRSGVLYGELARFVLRILGVKTKPGKINQQGPNGLPGPNGFPGPHNPHGNQNYLEGPKAAPSGAWDNVWGENGSS